MGCHRPPCLQQVFPTRQTPSVPPVLPLSLMANPGSALADGMFPRISSHPERNRGTDLTISDSLAKRPMRSEGLSPYPFYHEPGKRQKPERRFSAALTCSRPRPAVLEGDERSLRRLSVRPAAAHLNGRRS